MPRKKKTDAAADAASAAEPKIPKELLDQLITGPITQNEFESIYRALKKAILWQRPGNYTLHLEPTQRKRESLTAARCLAAQMQTDITCSAIALVRNELTKAASEVPERLHVLAFKYVGLSYLQHHPSNTRGACAKQYLHRNGALIA